MTRAYESVCSEVPGYEGCLFMARSASEDELIHIIQIHAEGTHSDTLSRQDVQRVIRPVEVGC